MLKTVFSTSEPALLPGSGARSPRGLLRIVLILAVPAFLACGSSDRTALRYPRNLLLITLDTQRPEFLGAYGAESARTPHLDRLAQGSLLFRNAYATAPFTGPSHATILTSRHPSAHGIIVNGGKIPARIRADSPNLARHLQGLGFETAAFVSIDHLTREMGFAEGFDDFTFVSRARPEGEEGGDGEKIGRLAAEWIREHGDRRFFVWVHNFNSHLPYLSAPDLHASMGVPEARIDPPRARRLPQPELREHYRVEVAETDRQLAPILEALTDAGLWEDTVVAVVGDHGEYLQEHGLIGHSQLYEQALRVPLFIRTPDRDSGTVRDEPVSLLDLAPTLTELLETPPLDGAQGVSLLHQRDEALPLFAEWRNHRMLEHPDREPKPGMFQISVMRGRFKLIDDVHHPEALELYDLTLDPGETRNLAESRPDLVRALRAEIREHIRRDLPEGLLGLERVEVSPEMRDRLRSLGYLN